MANDRIEVDAVALRQVLQALCGNSYEIRELQVLRGSPIFGDNPIDILLTEFNTWVESNKTTQADEEKDSE